MRLLVGILICCAALAGCTSSPKLPPVAKDALILAFGDSLTFGTGASTGESYPAVLEGLAGRRVLSAGVPGETTAEGLIRLPELLEREKPALMILCLGGNDMLRKMDQGQMAANLRSMVRLARERGVSVVLLAVPALGLSLTPPPLYRELADEFRIPCEQKALARILGKGSLKSDYIHPNAAGYRLLAEEVAKLLKKSGALPKTR